MLAPVIWRVVLSIPMLLFVSFLSFSLIYLIPGTVADVILGSHASRENAAALQAELGLDDVFLVQYARWVTNLVSGDFGVSQLTQRPIAEMLTARLPVTLSIVLGGLVVGVPIGIGIGVLSAIFAKSMVDHALTVTTTIMGALPAYVLALLLVIALAIHVRWFPAVGYQPLGHGFEEWLRSITLPALALGLPVAAQLSRQVRGAMVGALGSTYVRAALAQGLPFNRVVYLHALPNALIPILTVIGFRISTMIGTAFIVERVFALPGIGEMMVGAINAQDLPVVQAGVVVIGIIVICANTITDVSYAVVNPKARAR